MSLQYATVQNPSLDDDDVLKIPPMRRFFDNMPSWLRAHLKCYADDNKALSDPIDKKNALKNGQLIQFNSAKLVRYIVFDVDDMHPNDITPADYDPNTDYRHNCFCNWYVAGLPPPQIIIENEENGHCQYFYELEKPVSISSKSRQKIVFYLHAIRKAMTLELNADSAYTHFISRNPFNADNQKVSYNLVKPYSLDDLAKNLDLSTTFRNQKPDEYLGLGRNNDNFHTARFDSYSYKAKCSTYEQLYSFTLGRCKAINRDLCEMQQLDFKEVIGIAKSISNWTWNKYNGTGGHISEKLSAEKAKNGLKGGKATGAAKKKNNARKRAKALKLVASGISKAEVARQLKIDRTTVVRWCK